MIATTLTVLFVVTALATGLALADCWMRARLVFSGLQRERALLAAGFIPTVEAQEMRVRKTGRVAPAAKRSVARRYPVREHAAA